MNKKIISILFIIFSLNNWANVPKISTLKQKLSSESAEVSKLAGSIKSLEKKLSTTNDGYLDSVKTIESLEQKISRMRVSLTRQAKDISNEYNKAQKALNLYLLESVDEDNENSLLHKKIYMEVLQRKLIGLKEAEKKSNTLLEQINLYDQKLTETKSSEESIYNLIVELENKKKEMSQKYVSTLESKNRFESTLDKLKAKQRARAKISQVKVVKKRSSRKSKKSRAKITIPMLSPLDDYVAMVKSRDAVMIKFDDTVQIKAPASGKIVYSGELANYGNVIIIDHGSEVRSVLLGDLLVKVKKGEPVRKGQLLGYTVSDPGVIKSLRYEIRKKSKPVNALSWISNPKKLTL